jgi:histidyl-tRNA synthetase
VEKELQANGFDLEKLQGLWEIFSVSGSGEEKLAFLKNKIQLPLVKEGVEELEEILNYWESLGKNKDLIAIDYSLMRGLDYYTGPIYEIKIESGVGMGSISSGGRYDNLVELYGGASIPAVGVSFGIERLIDLVEKSEALQKKIGVKSLDIFIISFLKDKQTVFSLANRLRSQGLKVDFDLLQRPFKKQLQYGLSKFPQYLLFVGEDELQKNKYGFKNVDTQEQKEYSLEEIIAIFQ